MQVELIEQPAERFVMCFEPAVLSECAEYENRAERVRGQRGFRDGR